MEGTLGRSSSVLLNQMEDCVLLSTLTCHINVVATILAVKSWVSIHGSRRFLATEAVGLVYRYPF